MVAFTFLIFILVGRSVGQFCSYNDSNYTRTEYREVTKEVTTTVTTWTTIHIDCNLVEKFTSWFTTKSCDTETRKEEKIVTQNRTTVEEYTVYYCCPGYNNISNSCEYGCPVGKYGDNCTENCSCPSYCDRTSGECICDPGFRGENCSEGCTNGTYGINCQHTCRCENNGTCNSTDGSCTCKSPGWQGDLCNEECTNNTFGLFCNEACTCNDNQTCDPVNGNCTCKAGWKGENCSEDCDDMKYGINCLNNCTCNRNHTETCDKITGVCKCRPGFINVDCSRECPFGMYGDGCTGNCSEICTNTQYCDPENGTCICLGRHGANCTKDCEPGTYGPDCGWKCDCSDGTNGSESCNNRTGQCYCRPGWTGRTCDQEISKNATNTQKAKQTIASVVQENLVYIIPVIGLLIVVVVIVIVICHRKLHIRKKPQKDQDFLDNSGKENPSYDRQCALEGMPLKTSTSQSNIHLYEEAVLESQNLSELKKNHEPHTDMEPRDRDYKNDAENYDHAYSETNQVAECTEDSYAVPDKNSDLNLKSNGEKSRDKIQKEEVYDTTEEGVLKNEVILNEYNTFEDVQKMQRKVENTEKEMEEDYDVITHTGSQKKTIKDLEHYSSFEQVRKLSLQDSLEEDDMYNVLHENLPQHRSAPVVHSSYHHISLKSKTIDGEVFNNVSSDIASTDSRKSQERKLSEKSNLLHESIVEESDNEDSDESSKGRENGGHNLEEDITEVIYDECDLDENNEEMELVDDASGTIPAAKLEIDISDVVYEECDDLEKEESRPPSGALYEDVEDETEDDKQEKVMIHSKDKRDDSHLKKRSERRKEDYEDIVL